MAHVAIHIEGGLISSDLLERIAATPESVEGQRPGDFGVEGRLSEEIQSAFSDAATYWNAFQARLHRGKESATTITRETWMLPLLEELGYDLRFQRAALQAGGECLSDLPPLRRRRKRVAGSHRCVGPGARQARRGQAEPACDGSGLSEPQRMRSGGSSPTEGDCGSSATPRASPSRAISSSTSKRMMAGGLYSEFVLFYRLVHASRLPRSAGDAHECLLERYHQQGIEEGGRVREKLRDGVKEALEILGTGLLAHPASATLREKFTRHAN